jgi:hypothetical protein
MGRQAVSSSNKSKYLRQTYRLMLPNTGVGQMVCLFFISTLFTLWIANPSVTAKTLFQSPASPVSPPAEPAQQPPPAGQSESSAPQEPVTQQPGVEQGSGPESLSPTLPAETIESAPAASEELQPESSRPSRERDSRNPADEEAESRNFILDRVELIDSVVVSGAYLWLCCGVALFLLVPIFMLVLYIRGRSKMGQNDRF